MKADLFCIALTPDDLDRVFVCLKHAESVVDNPEDKKALGMQRIAGRTCDASGCWR